MSAAECVQAGGFTARLSGALAARFDLDADTIASGRAALWVLGIRCVGAVVAYALQVVMARLLGPSEYGTFALVWIWVLLLGHLSPLGFSQVVCRYLPFYHARREMALLRGFMLTGPLLVLGFAVATAVLGCAAVFMAGAHLTPAQQWVFAAGLCMVPLVAIHDVSENTARAFHWPILAIAPAYILRPALTLIGLVALVAIGMKADAWTAVAVTFAAILAGFVVQAGIVVYRLRSVVPRGPLSMRLPEWMKSALPLVFVDGTHLIFTNADVLILSLFVEPEAIAVYYAASRILQLVAFGQYAAAAATAPRFSALAGLGDMARLGRLARYTMAFNVIVSAVAAALVFWTAPMLLGIFGDGFENGANILVILVCGMLVQAAAGPGEDVLNMLGHQRACAASFVGTLVLNIALNFALIPVFGMTGAALATALSVAARSFVLSFLVKRRIGLDIALLPPLRAAGPAAAKHPTGRS